MNEQLKQREETLEGDFVDEIVRGAGRDGTQNFSCGRLVLLLRHREVRSR